jgi:hypothetical protein
MNNYELEIDIGFSIAFFNFPHTRRGLTRAFKKVEFYKNRMIYAKIVSSKDGLIYQL